MEFLHCTCLSKKKLICHEHLETCHQSSLSKVDKIHKQMGLFWASCLFLRQWIHVFPPSAPPYRVRQEFLNVFTALLCPSGCIHPCLFGSIIIMSSSSVHWRGAAMDYPFSDLCTEQSKKTPLLYFQVFLFSVQIIKAFVIFPLEAYRLTSGRDIDPLQWHQLFFLLSTLWCWTPASCISQLLYALHPLPSSPPCCD